VSARGGGADDLRRRVGLVLAPLFALALAVLPGWPLAERKVAAIAAAIVVCWITEAIPIPLASLLAPALLVVTGALPAREAFAPFADPILFLFLASFFLAEAMTEHGLDRRLALRLLATRWVGGRVGRARTALLVGSFAISMWASNTATTAMVYPIALGALAVAAPGPRFATGAMLGVAFSATLGGFGTPVGTVPNLITIRILEQHAGVRVDFVRWMAVGLPVALSGLAALLWVVGRRFPPTSTGEAGAVDGRALGDYVAAERARIGRPGRAEWMAGGAFLIAVLLWLTPAVVGLVSPSAGAAAEKRLPEAVGGVLAAALLFLVRYAPGRPTLTWRRASTVDWGAMLVFGGGLTLGGEAFRTGLADRMGRAIVSLSGISDLWSLTFVMIVATLVLTEMASNIAASSVMVPLAIAVAKTLGVPPVPPALAAGLASSLGFMLPVSTPPNAIVYGSGLIPISAMMRTGIVLDLIGAAVVFATVRILCPLLGLV